MGQTAPARLPFGGTNGGPLYKQVKADLLTRISKGEWAPSQALPSEQSLATQYRVGIATIRAAIGELVASDIVDRVQGKGTFVSAHNRERDIYRFFHVVRDDGTKDIPKSELVFIKKTKADGATNDALRLTARGMPAEVFKIRNTLTALGRRVVVSDVVIPAASFPGLTRKIIEKSGETLYGVYQSRYQVNIIRITEKLRAVKTPPDVCKLLSIPKDEPTLEIGRTAYTFDDVPIEIRRSWVRTDDYHYLYEQGGPND